MSDISDKIDSIIKKYGGREFHVDTFQCENGKLAFVFTSESISEFLNFYSLHLINEIADGKVDEDDNGFSTTDLQKLVDEFVEEYLNSLADGFKDGES